jgi:CRP/FNR family transcriptional regulator, cyclic AMP receptor protein
MATTPDLTALLATTELFAPLPSADRARIAERMRPAAFKSGQLIFSRGDNARDLYLLQRGRVRLSVLSAEGREIALAHATDGGIFGEIAVLDGGRRTANATAISAATAFSLTRSALLDVMATTPSVAQAMIASLCRRLRESDHMIEAIALHPIEVRLARFLLAAVMLEQPGATGRAWPLTIGMSQSEVAMLVGASRPKVNAALTQLEDCGAIRRDGPRILCDIDLLKSFAAND